MTEAERALVRRIRACFDYHPFKPFIDAQSDEDLLAKMAILAVFSGEDLESAVARAEAGKAGGRAILDDMMGRNN